MTGTAETEASEFANTYELPVVPIPPNRPLRRQDNPDLIYKSEDAKFAAVVDDIAERHATGQPILVGTASVSKSEHLSRLLDKKGIPHEVLNAKQHFREAEIVAQAGRVGGVTVATNMAGRGVDIILGGNPEGLAAREAQARGIDVTTEEGQAALEALHAEFKATCEREGEEVRSLGGLYVLGSERHESRRIDNQLRGRSGRQGDPGESRFFLSLEDDLMRLFATGAMNWVMGRALPDDVPIEAKMVTKAIERAQNTVEGRNAESRKDVLKYDDVMNEQRKVIYRRRLQIIDGEDLREETEDLLRQAITDLVASSCPSDYPEEWDLPRLVTEVTQYYPTKFVAEDLADASTVDQITESILTEALELYAERDETIPGGEEIARQLERDIMLQIIDQRWQDHLADMDYLREGINLRAMGNQDPLVAYQREGFAMFAKLMDGISDDYLRYVFHVQVLAEPAPEPDLDRANYLAADDPVQGEGAITAALAMATPEEIERAAAAMSAPDGPAGGGASWTGAAGAPGFADEGETQAPIVKSDREKIGRNEPCWCGSGKKYKLCHGAN
jgi:preprotein translocase subunit SecA